MSAQADGEIDSRLARSRREQSHDLIGQDGDVSGEGHVGFDTGGSDDTM